MHRKFAANEKLTPSEIYHATNAREDGASMLTKRNIDKPIAYCGHSIIFWAPQDSVRHSGRTINLDVRAFQTDCLIAVKHKAREVHVIGNPTSEDIYRLNDITSFIDNYLHSTCHNLSLIIFKLKSLITRTEVDPRFNNENLLIIKNDLIEKLNSTIESLLQLNNITLERVNELQTPLNYLDQIKELILLSQPRTHLFFQPNDHLLKTVEEVKVDLTDVTNSFDNTHPCTVM